MDDLMSMIVTPGPQSEEGSIWGKFYAEMSEASQQYNITQINDSQIKLQLISLQDKGSGALSADKAARVRHTLNEFISLFL